ncbi:MAG: hypothetical protein ABI205_03365 [Gemmatimonadaceae bacterium]
MSFRLLVSSLGALSLFAAMAPLAPMAHAQSGGYSDGLVSGDYLRMSAGTMGPVRPQGSLHDWNRGTSASVAWESWYGGSATDPGLIGFGVGGDYGRLPFNQRQFLPVFTTPLGGTATSATASAATVFSIETTFRVRIPTPFIMPSVLIGLGYLDFHPSTIHYTAPGGDGTTTQQHRRGAALSIGAGLDKHIVQRVAVFGEAVYSYGFTSLGQGLVTPRGTCTSNGCDVLKNTTLGTLRGGLRLQVGK